ncbi:MAG: ABC transporter substrate-binding protein [Anaeromicrobium sp.]|uniref:ABC transporter substrate-binding protein n=1 Tax=Anaeromicrobium sp. TaxID=1929132 RepID=UPI0025E573F6|nr:ABC transporter substrate-binding protein [Anaeromicrobium sp.]MCT4595550.1 ABC transporter substrate-binding protein [Anaeromicrobium sp.]
MKKFKKTALFLTLLLIISIASIGCDDKGLTTVRLAEVTHSVFYAPQYVAITNGFFEEEGIELEIINGQGADKTMTALLSYNDT